jgi:transcriptional regulator with XRE-family HTH domain
LKGEKIKEIRIEKGYTLSDIAEKTGYTASFLSQIERNLKNPSLEALRKIADSLEVPIISFLIDEYKQISVDEDMNDEYNRYLFISGEKRKKVVMPEICTEYQFITPIISDKTVKPRMVGFYVELKPKSWVSEKLIAHYAEEGLFIVKGQIEAHVDNKIFLLNMNDSFYINSNVPHNYLNIGDDNAIIISYLSPPVY